LISLFRTAGDIFIANTNYQEEWTNFIILIKYISKYMILISMIALGLKIKINKFRQVGFKPLVIGFVAAVSVGVSSIIF